MQLFKLATLLAVTIVQCMPMQETPDDGDQAALQQTPNDEDDNTEAVLLQQQQQPPGPEPRPGEELEDEPAGSSTQSVFLEDDEEQCVRCPRFSRRCRCRFPEDCRYIRGSCFTCPRWRCVVRSRRGFPGRGRFPDDGFPGRGGRPIDFAGPGRR